MVATLAFGLVYLAIVAFHVMASSLQKPWQYGVSMSPYYSAYDSVEMPTAGMHWTIPPNNALIYFWVSSSTTDGVFVQNGYAYNGYDTDVPITNDSVHWLPARSWAMFWCYCISGVCHGDGVPPPSDWNADDHIYFSIAVYPSQKTISFMFTDMSRCQLSGNAIVCTAIAVKIIGVSFSGRLSGNVGGIAESYDTSGFGDIYVDKVALWAQDITIGERNCGNAYVYDAYTYAPTAYSPSPNDVRIYVYDANVFQLGFNQGYHYSTGTQLWSADLGAGTELVPPSDP
jgi:hypothetical protein